MSFDECKNLALKYHVEDIPSALMQGTSLSRLLRELEASTISKISHHFLNKKKFLALEKLAHGIISFEEYESLAKEEKNTKIKNIEDAKYEKEARKQKFQAEWRAAYKSQIKFEKAQRKLEKEQQVKLEQDPIYIRKKNLIKLKQKYDLDFYIDKNDYSRLMSLVEKIDNGDRASPQDIIWLKLSRNDLFHGYFTEILSRKYHKNEAEYIKREYELKRDHWLAVNASSHYRKANEPNNAISILSKIKLDDIKNNKLKSAICTTHGGALRDMTQWNNAIILAECAHSYTPDNFRPCTLLGAIYMETSQFTLGQEWYNKAIQRGFSEKSVDDEIKSIFKKADKIQKESLRSYLLKKDPHRYRWVNNYLITPDFQPEYYT